tara:strand:+ start:1489 stop:2121 length:633 start_codon:yes stop_codon:yes gene_type:complete
MSIKLKGSTDGSVTLQAPADTSPTGTDKTLILPTGVGSANQYLKNGSTPGTLEFGSIVQGITELDQWYLTADHTTNATLTNLARNNFTSAASQIGTGMSVSSGIFTFPSTGKYLIYFFGGFRINGSDSVSIDLKVTTNNSTYTIAARALEGNNGSGTRNGSGSILYFIDVTDTANVKVKFDAGSLNSGSEVVGFATDMATGFTFIRIGDT